MMDHGSHAHTVYKDSKRLARLKELSKTALIVISEGDGIEMPLNENLEGESRRAFFSLREAIDARRRKDPKPWIFLDIGHFKLDEPLLLEDGDAGLEIRGSRIKRTKWFPLLTAEANANPNTGWIYGECDGEGVIASTITLGPSAMIEIAASDVRLQNLNIELEGEQPDPIIKVHPGKTPLIQDCTLVRLEPMLNPVWIQGRFKSITELEGRNWRQVKTSVIAQVAGKGVQGAAGGATVYASIHAAVYGTVPLLVSGAGPLATLTGSSFLYSCSAVACGVGVAVGGGVVVAGVSYIAFRAASKSGESSNTAEAPVREGQEGAGGAGQSRQL
jgi:hypothetical protein